MLPTKKLIAGLIPVGLISALAAAAMAVVPAGAAAAACTTDVLCGEGNVSLRDDFTEPPAATTLTELEEGETTKRTVKGGFGASGLAVNTAGKLVFCVAKTKFGNVCNENPKGYAFFGVSLDHNEATGAGKKASGWVTFVDIQRATSALGESPVYSGEQPYKPGEGRGGLGPWEISVCSDAGECTINGVKHAAGEVIIESTSLYFSALPLTATGTFVGKWVQPSTTEKPTECKVGGGVELAIPQTGITLSEGEKAEVGSEKEGAPGAEKIVAGKHAFLCFVSANNYLYPELSTEAEKAAPVWTPHHGNIWKD